MSIVVNKMILEAMIKDTGLDEATIQKVFTSYNKIEDEIYKGWMNNYRSIVEGDKKDAKNERGTKRGDISASVSSDS